MDILSKMQDIIRDIFDDESIVLTTDTTAADIEDWDSVTNMIIIEEVEKTFSIRFTTSELMSIKNIGEYVDCITKKINR